MGVAYDKHYKREDYFGKPYPQLVEFFRSLSKSKYILDLGCGQGRDSIALGQMGYKVKGVDISSVGIQQMNELARTYNIDVSGVVNDLYSYPITDDYDIILLDSILHFYKNDVSKECLLVERIISEMKSGSILCVYMQKGAQREKILKSIISKSDCKYEILIEKHFNHADFNSDYFVYALLKVM